MSQWQANYFKALQDNIPDQKRQARRNFPRAACMLAAAVVRPELDYSEMPAIGEVEIQQTQCLQYRI